MCMVRRMIGAQVYSVCWLCGGGLVGLLVVLIVPLFLSFVAMLGLCCFLRVTHVYILDCNESMYLLKVPLVLCKAGNYRGP